MSLEAYDVYLKGRFVGRRMTPADLRRAIAYFEQAIALDPTYARAYATLADMHALLVVFADQSANAETPRARGYAMKAVALDPMLAEAHWALGHVLIALEFDIQAAMRELQRAMALDPGHVDSRHLYSICLYDLGRLDEAVAELTRTLATDPLLAAASMTLGRTYLAMGQLDRGIAHLRDSLELSPGFSYARGYLAHAYLEQGRRDEAVAEFERAVLTGSARDRAQLAYGYARIGRRSEAMAIVQDIVAPANGRYPPPFHVAMAYAGLGETAETFHWLERAADEHDPHVLGVKFDFAFRSLHNDPRFGALVRRLGVVSVEAVE
jgi:tetratricopeptide (TPR) repeat protein